MKPKNFPGRKNRRRTEALERCLMKGTDKETAENTAAKIISDSEARSIRTKKRR